MFSEIIAPIKQVLESVLLQYGVEVATDYHLQLRGIATDGETPLCFSDDRGNFMWIEPSSSITAVISRDIETFTDCHRYYTHKQEFTLYGQSPQFDAEKWLRITLSAMSAIYGVTLKNSDYDTQRIIESKYRQFPKNVIDDAIIGFCDWALISVTFTTDLTFGAQNKECSPIDICKNC